MGTAPPLPKLLLSQPPLLLSLLLLSASAPPPVPPHPPSPPGPGHHCRPSSSRPHPLLYSPQPPAPHRSVRWSVPESGLPLRLSVLTASVHYLSATQKALNKGFLVDERPWVCKDTGCGRWLTPCAHMTVICSVHAPGDCEGVEGLLGGVPTCRGAFITVPVAWSTRARWLPWGHRECCLSASFSHIFS